MPIDPDDPLAGYGLGGGAAGDAVSGRDGAAERQLVLATNTYDIRADLAHESPVPVVNPLPLLGHAFC